jgi:LacI family transcriptional regulator
VLRVDNHGGAAAMVGHLVEQGHRAIAFVGGPSDNFDALERRRGFRDALAELGLEPAVELEGDFTEESGQRAGRALLSLRPRPDAVFAANDAMAIGLLTALREAGVAVPGDLALGGFDDIPLARLVDPPLTSVRVPIAALGQRALERLFAAVGNGHRHAPEHDLVATELVVRRSTGNTTSKRRRHS